MLSRSLARAFVKRGVNGDGMPTLGSYFDSDSVSICQLNDSVCRFTTLNSKDLSISSQPWPALACFSQSKVTVVFSIIRLFPSVKQRTQVIDLLKSVQDLTRPSPGCVGCWLSEEDYANSHIRYAEQWESEEALHNHIRSDLYRRVLNAMELSKRAPEVGFYRASDKQGFELIETVRGEAKQPSSWQPG